jgi:hypothetical protein
MMWMRRPQSSVVNSSWNWQLYCCCTVFLRERSRFSLNSTAQKMAHWICYILVWPQSISNLMHKIVYLFIYSTFINILRMYRAVRCSSSGGLIVSMQHLISSLCIQMSCLKLHYNNFRHLTCLQSDDIRCCIDTIRPPEDEQRTARNMRRILINVLYINK